MTVVVFVALTFETGWKDTCELLENLVAATVLDPLRADFNSR
jgi:hypothetical protein